MGGDRRSSGKSFGVGWLQDQLRARFDIRGPIGEPWDVEGKVQVGMEARPSLPWEYGNARWMPVAGSNNIGAGGAGTFASVSISVPTTGTRALIIEQIWAHSGSGVEGLYVNQPFVAGNVGFGLLDGRLAAGGVAGSWLTPVPDAASIAQNAAVALPAATGRIRWAAYAAGQDTTLLDRPLVLAPGQTVAVFEEAGNNMIRVSASGYLVPMTDIT